MHESALEIPPFGCTALYLLGNTVTGQSDNGDVRVGKSDRRFFKTSKPVSESSGQHI
jgi:hypothetical protein